MPPERWVKRGKARARAQAEAKASDRSQTICSTREQSCGEGSGGGGDPGVTPWEPLVRKCLGPTAGSEATVETIWPEMPQQGLHPRGLPRNHGPGDGRKKMSAARCGPPPRDPTAGRAGRHGNGLRRSGSESQICNPHWSWVLTPSLGPQFPVCKLGWQCPAVEQRPFLKILWPECSAVPRTEPWEVQVRASTASTLHMTCSLGCGVQVSQPLRSTHQNAPMGPRWQADPHQAGDEVGGRGAVVAAHPGGQGGHGGIVQVEGTAVRRGLGLSVLSAACQSWIRRGDTRQTPDFKRLPARSTACGHRPHFANWALLQLPQRPWIPIIF